jgi:glycyl-tRNA synthetase (class II)
MPHVLELSFGADRNLLMIVDVSYEEEGRVVMKSPTRVTVYTLGEIDTPFCIAVDYDSLEDGTVTIRDRDTMEQKRIHRNEVAAAIRGSH